MSLTATMPRSRSRAAAMRPRQDLTPSPAGERQSEPRFCSRLLEHFADALMILPDQAGAACPMWLVYHCREVALGVESDISPPVLRRCASPRRTVRVAPGRLHCRSPRLRDTDGL